jgi:carboxyl-terminal processing protease
LDRIDRGRRWLTQEDVAKLAPYKDKIDDESRSGTYAFLDLSIDLIDKGLLKSQAYYKEVLAQPFDFSIAEEIEMDADKKPFAKNDAELKDYWRKALKYEVLSRVTESLKEQKSKPAEEQKSQEQLEKEAREKVLKLYDDWYGRMARNRRNDKLSNYLNTLTSLYDPHTSYFEPIDKENFDINFKGSLEGIGARLQEDSDFTKISSIVVGGPAWKTKEVEEGDLVTKVAQGEEEPKDIQGMRVDDVVQLIRGKKGTLVRLWVKKKDGSIKIVPIIRDLIVIEESFAKSLIIEQTPGEKIGYIYLPGFYADFEDRSGRFSSVDVQAEIEKLKTEQVKGIILDIRDNGGGSLDEVRKMSGLFIKEGPIVQVKSRDYRPEVLSDVDPSVAYSGPLVVMTNNFSASASEILAAALQDYQRAVIVGSKSTFGKGTVQRFVDLDRVFRGNPEVKPLGQVKLTIQKYYRVNGGSVQLKGVTPDIVLPDMYHFIETGERDLEFPMDWSEIPAVRVQQDVYKIKQFDKIKTNSTQRIAKDTTFQHILENAAWVKSQRDISVLPLEFNAYTALQTKRDESAARFDKLFDKEVITNVNNLVADSSVLASTEDESKKARNQSFLSSVKKDIYVKEVLLIMHDMITLQ